MPRANQDFSPFLQVNILTICADPVITCLNITIAIKYCRCIVRFRMLAMLEAKSLDMQPITILRTKSCP